MTCDRDLLERGLVGRTRLVRAHRFVDRQGNVDDAVGHRMDSNRLVYELDTAASDGELTWSGLPLAMVSSAAAGRNAGAG